MHQHHVIYYVSRYIDFVMFFTEEDKTATKFLRENKHYYEETMKKD